MFRKNLLLKVRIRGFSLVELLVVIAIVAVLATVTGPSLLTSQKASSLTTGGNRLADLLMLAKQSALSRNMITAVVLVTSTKDKLLENRTLGMLEMGGDYEWRQVGGWTFLPEAVQVVDSGALPPANALPVPADAPEPRFQKLRGDANPKYTAFVFYPDGRMRAGLPSPRRASVRFQSDVNEASPHNFYDIVFNAETSGLRIERP